MSQIDDGIVSNHSSNPTFEEIKQARFSRRGMIKGSIGVAAGATALTSVDVLSRALPVSASGGGFSSGGDRYDGKPDAPLLGFEGIDVSSADTITIAPGYTAKVLIAWGDPVSDGPTFQQDASNSAEDQAQQWGMHNDGIVYFPIKGSKRGLIVQNHEYTDDVLLFTDGTANWTAEKTAKSQNAHGVGIIEVRNRGRHGWEVVRPSPYARRITAQTPIAVTGPAAGNDLLKTSADPTGTNVLGTVNNCAMGYTPWGTYLACEENFNGYFRKTAPPNELEARYGINANGAGYLWHTTDTRFNVDVEPNEPNRFGWVVEIDPFRPESTPIKRTALGRLKHEGAWVQEARDGRVVVYMGDDQQNEYIYRFVSADTWKAMVRNGVSPLDEGTLYAARFNANGMGEWLPLTPDNPALTGWSLADIMINSRHAADLAGATKMDRPEWIDTYPDSLMAVATLTNNSSRTAANVDAANPRPSNVYGHIIRWGYDHDFTGDAFWWDIFALAGDRDVPEHGATVNGDKYGSPDGLYVAPSGRMWIQTDVSGSTQNTGAYAGFGNNQMLCADPITRRTRRFLVGPVQCEITGAFATPDEKTMFVGIQHPGEAPSGALDPANPKQYSSWPDGDAGGRPRSSLLVITKDDGGQIGS